MSAVRRRILLLDDSYISLGSVLQKKIFFLHFKQMSILEEEWGRKSKPSGDKAAVKKFSPHGDAAPPRAGVH